MFSDKWKHGNARERRKTHVFIKEAMCLWPLSAKFDYHVYYAERKDVVCVQVRTGQQGKFVFSLCDCIISEKTKSSFLSISSLYIIFQIQVIGIDNKLCIFLFCSYYYTTYTHNLNSSVLQTLHTTQKKAGNTGRYRQIKICPYHNTQHARSYR